MLFSVMNSESSFFFFFLFIFNLKKKRGTHIDIVCLDQVLYKKNSNLPKTFVLWFGPLLAYIPNNNFPKISPNF